MFRAITEIAHHDAQFHYAAFLRNLRELLHLERGDVKILHIGGEWSHVSSGLWVLEAMGLLEIHQPLNLAYSVRPTERFIDTFTIIEEAGYEYLVFRNDSSGIALDCLFLALDGWDNAPVKMRRHAASTRRFAELAQRAADGGLIEGYKMQNTEIADVEPDGESLWATVETTLSLLEPTS